MMPTISGERDRERERERERRRRRASGQDGGEGRHTVSPPTTKRRTTTILKQKTTTTDRNRITRKSDNQGDMEETFIQTGRRGRDGKPGWMGLVATGPDPETGGLWNEQGRQCDH